MYLGMFRLYACCMQYLKGYGWSVGTGLTLKELHEVVAPRVEGDDDFEMGSGNAAYVKAFSC